MPPVVSPRRGFSLIELMIVVAIIGILAAIAVPNFMRFQARSRQAEAKSNLRTWFTAQRSFLSENGRYSEAYGEVGFAPERGNRYAYYFASTRACEERKAGGVATPSGANCISVDAAKYKVATLTPDPIPVGISWSTGAGDNPKSPGLSGPCPGCNIDAFAVADIDNEKGGVDTWHIATKDAKLSTPPCGGDEAVIVAGLPMNTFNDVDCDL